MNVADILIVLTSIEVIVQANGVPVDGYRDVRIVESTWTASIQSAHVAS